MKVPFYKHQLGKAEADEVREALSGLFLTTGPRTVEFEEKFACYLGAAAVLGVTSATDALFLTLKAWDIGPGDEVITTPLTFIASANAVEHAGGRPVFVDVEADTGNLDANLVEEAITPRTRAILPVHLYGQMCDMRALRTIADEHRLRILEDCAHSTESVRGGQRPAGLGDAACFSFYATKNLASGEGGAIALRDPSLVERLKLLRLHGMSKSAYGRYTGKYQHWDMLELGYKSNMFDIQAALLLPQLPHIESKLAQRRRIAAHYDERFAAMPGVELPAVRPDVEHARHLYTIWVDPDRRDEVLNSLQEAGIGVAVNFRAIHLLTYYREKYGFERGSFPQAELIGDRTISLPMYPQLTLTAVDVVADAVERALAR